MAYFANQYTQPIGALGAYFANQYTQPINGLGTSPDGLGACLPCMAGLGAAAEPTAAPSPRSGLPTYDSRLGVLVYDLAAPAAIGVGIGWLLGSKKHLRNAAIGVAVPVGMVALYLGVVAIGGRT